MMPWWLWVLFGLTLLLLEVLTPGGFVVLFFGIASVVVGVLVGLDVGGPAWFQWLLFSVLSVVSLLLFRGRLLAKFQSQAQESGGKIDTLVGEVVVLLEDLAPGAVGKAELRGTAWNTQNEGARPLSKGQRCRVQRVEGLTLWICAL
jgi:membrane protein implicated in regulation of membrane protease activity